MHVELLGPIPHSDCTTVYGDRAGCADGEACVPDHASSNDDTVYGGCMTVYGDCADCADGEAWAYW